MPPPKPIGSRYAPAGSRRASQHRVDFGTALCTRQHAVRTRLEHLRASAQCARTKCSEVCTSQRSSMCFQSHQRERRAKRDPFDSSSHISASRAACVTTSLFCLRLLALQRCTFWRCATARLTEFNTQSNTDACGCGVCHVVAVAPNCWNAIFIISRGQRN